MKQLLMLLGLLIAVSASAKIDFDKYFDGRALRIDYTFAGDSTKQYIYVNEYASLDKWAGRRVNLDKMLLEGTADITMRSKADGNVIYCQSFTSHFQDWTGTQQATMLKCAYEHVMILPMPRAKVEIEIRLFDFKQRPVTTLKHEFDPKDILVRNLGKRITAPETKDIIRSGSSDECIDIAILAEGYTKEQLPDFYADAQKAIDAIFNYEPFKGNKNKFNVIAVGAISPESGISEPAKGIWKETAVNTFFDFLYTPRLLGATNLRRVNDLLAKVPYEHIIILANTETYGGCGVYNSYEITPTKHSQFLPVVVHEFGHSFAGLGDEYFYDDAYTQYYYPDVEPWHDNLTTLANFKSKWADMLPKGSKIPTPAEEAKKLSPDDVTTLGVFEGGGYQSKGVYRPTINCRMRTNNVPDFCPVCRRGIMRVIDYHLKEMNWKQN